MELTQFEQHVLLYAKGWYVRSRNTMMDLTKIALVTGALEKKEEQEVIRLVSKLAFKCILEMGDYATPYKMNKDGTIAKYPNGQEILQLSWGDEEPNSWDKQFSLWMLFIYQHKTEIISNYGCKLMDVAELDENNKAVLNERVFESYLRKMIDESILNGMLAAMVGLDLSETEMPKPNESILRIATGPALKLDTKLRKEDNDSQISSI